MFQEERVYQGAEARYALGSREGADFKTVCRGQCDLDQRGQAEAKSRHVLKTDIDNRWAQVKLGRLSPSGQNFR